MNKLAKARKTRKSPGTLGFKKFGPGKLRVQQVWGQNISINFLAELDNSKKIICFLNFFFGCPFKNGTKSFQILSPNLPYAARLGIKKRTQDKKLRIRDSG